MQLLKFFSGITVPGTARANKAAVLGATKNLDTLDIADGGLKMGAVVIAATALEINQAVDDSARFQAAGAALTLTVAAHNKKIIKLDTAAGSVVTLPDATGTGAWFDFLVTLLATSNSHKVQVPDANNVMTGMVFGSRIDSGNAVLGFAAQATSDTITLNRTTTGSVSLGEWLRLTDIAADTWHVQGFLSATGAAFATPFSAAVS